MLKWEANEGEPPNLSDSDGKVREANYKTTVTMTFTPLDDDTRTLVEIREEGWRENQGALEASYGNCQGWSQMLDALKVWVEHGINLREGCTSDECSMLASGAMYLSRNAKSEQPASARDHARFAPPKAERDYLVRKARQHSLAGLFRGPIEHPANSS